MKRRELGPGDAFLWQERAYLYLGGGQSLDIDSGKLAGISGVECVSLADLRITPIENIIPPTPFTVQSPGGIRIMGKQEERRFGVKSVFRMNTGLLMHTRIPDTRLPGVCLFCTNDCRDVGMSLPGSTAYWLFRKERAEQTGYKLVYPLAMEIETCGKSYYFPGREAL